MADAMPSLQTVIHPTAIIHPRASIGRGVQIGAYCTVGDGVVLHDEMGDVTAGDMVDVLLFEGLA